jgi:hypothetical protein
MPNWKKLITSGSAASLSSVTTSGDITIPVTNKIYLDGGGDSYISTTTESSNNNISFVIGGNTRVKMLPHIMYINSTGANGLVINNDEGTTTNSGRIFFEGNSTSVIFQEADDLSFRTGGTTGASSGTERFRVNTSGVAVTGAIDVSGALTLGTALAVAEGGTGATTLTSNGILTGNGTSAIQAESNLTFDGTDLAIAGAGKLYFGGGSHTYISEDADDRLRFFVGGAEFMRFTESTGNSFSIYEDVYIPDDKKIHFGDGNDLKIYHYNAAGDSRINVANNPLLITYNDVDRFRLASNDLVINEGGGDYNFRVEGDTDANLLFVDAGEDRVGIGTNSPDSFVHISASVGSSTASLHVEGSGSEVFAVDGTNGRLFTVTDELSGSLFSANTIAGLPVIEAFSDYKVTLGPYSSQTTVDSSGNLSVSGEIRATGDVIAYYSSDERFKDNIQPIQDSLYKISKIGGYEYDWNDKQSTYEGHDVGVIAQEIHKVLPEVVTEREDGYLAVKYEKVVPLLIESIKELKQEVDDIKKNCKCLSDGNEL